MPNRDPREALRHAIVFEHLLHTKLQECERRAARWQARAELASRRGDDDLAREALVRRRHDQRLAAQYLLQYREQARAIERLKHELRSELSGGIEQRFRELEANDRLERDLAALKERLARG